MVSGPGPGASLTKWRRGLLRIAYRRVVQSTHTWTLAVSGTVAVFGLVAFVFDRFPIVRDNRRFMLEAFWYVTEYLRHTGTFPSWASMGWGVPLALLSNNYLILSPWRLVGYAYSGLLGFSTLDGYRLALFAGFAGLIISFYFLFREITGERSLSALLTLLVTFSGLTFGNFHQEQALSTVFWMPSMLFLLFRGARENRPRDLTLAGGVLGAACTAHYPQIPLLFGALLATVFIATGNRHRLLPRAARLRHFALAAGLFLVLSSPTWLAVLSDADAFSSPFRQTQSIFTSSYADYLTLNREMKSSAKPEYLLGYLSPPGNPFTYLLDDYPYYIGRLPLLMAITSVVCTGGITGALAVMVGGLAVLTLGINSFAVPALFQIGGPFISMFRQWYHFQSVLNLVLFLMSAVGARELIFKGSEWSRGRRLIFMLVAACVSAAFIARRHSLLDAAWVGLMLAGLAVLCVARGRVRHLALAGLALLAVADQWAYATAARDAVHHVARLQDELRDGRPLTDAEESLDQLYARHGVLPFSLNLLLENRKITELRTTGRPEARPEAMNAWVLLPASPGASVRLHAHSIPGDLWVEVSTPERAQLIFMNAFDRGWRVEINGRHDTVEVALGAFVGVGLESGSSKVHLYHSSLWWVVAAGIHFVALVGIGCASRSAPLLPQRRRSD